MNYHEERTKKEKRAHRYGISVRINSDQKDKMNEIREYLNMNKGELTKGFYYRWSKHTANDGDVMRFLIENFNIPTNIK